MMQRRNADCKVTSKEREAYPCLVLLYLSHHHLCKVAQQPAALCIKLALLAVDDTPAGPAPSGSDRTTNTQSTP